MVKMHCRIELYDPDPDRQAEIDNNIKTQANKAEQEVYAVLTETISTSSRNGERCRRPSSRQPSF